MKRIHNFQWSAKSEKNTLQDGLLLTNRGFELFNLSYQRVWLVFPCLLSITIAIIVRCLCICIICGEKKTIHCFRKHNQIDVCYRMVGLDYKDRKSHYHYMSDENINDKTLVRVELFVIRARFLFMVTSVVSINRMPAYTLSCYTYCSTKCGRNSRLGTKFIFIKCY